MFELQQNIEVNRERCLLRLLTQAEGRAIDAYADEFLIEQITASHIGSLEEGDVTRCQIGGCALTCLTKNESGILRVIDTDGTAICE